MRCEPCGRFTDNPKFCSKSCSCSFNNARTPRRKPKVRDCRNCGRAWQLPTSQHRSGHGWCPTCTERNAKKRRTLGHIRTLLSVKNKHRSWLHVCVRQHARDLHRVELKLASCEVCGYKKHVELCHIRAVSTFPDEAELGEVNARTNVRFLCPNHHWEFDNKRLRKKDLRKLKPWLAEESNLAASA